MEVDGQQPQRRRCSALANFGHKKIEPMSNRNVADQITIAGLNTPVELLASSDRQMSARIIHYSFSSMNDTTVEDPELCSYYASLMMGFAPGLRDAMVEALEMKGYTVSIREGTTEEDFVGVDLTGAFEYSTGLVYFGQCVLLLYKNISINSYEKFMRNRINALTSFVGASTIPGISLILSKDRAAKIRTMLGSQQGLRVAVLDFIISASRLKHPFGAMCGYLCNILSWTDMTSISMIVDTLLVTRSPVVTDVRVANELRSIARAIHEINSCPNPQFFRITESSAKTRVLDRANFPILTAVAQTIKTESSPAMANFVSTGSQNNPIVEDLVRIHRQYMTGARRNILPAIAEYVMSYDDPSLIEEGINLEN